MPLYLRLLLAFAIGGAFTALTVDFNKSNYLQTFLIWSSSISLGLLTPISLYSSNSVKISVVNDRQIPKYKKSTKIRERLGIVFCALFVLIFLVFLSVPSLVGYEQAYIFLEHFEGPILGPAIYLFLVGIYLLLTKQCSYCKKLNSPMNHECTECGNQLEPHILDKHINAGSGH